MSTNRDIITTLRTARSVTAPATLRERIETRIHLLPQPIRVGFVGTLAFRFAAIIAALVVLGTGAAVARTSKSDEMLFPIKQFVQRVVHMEAVPDPTPTPSSEPGAVFIEPAHAERKTPKSKTDEQKIASDSARQEPTPRPSWRQRNRDRYNRH